MFRTREGLLAFAVVGVLLIASACGGGPSKEELANAEEWAWLTGTKQELDGKRQELADLKMAAMEAIAHFVETLRSSELSLVYASEALDA